VGSERIYQSHRGRGCICALKSLLVTPPGPFLVPTTTSSVYLPPRPARASERNVTVSVHIASWQLARTSAHPHHAACPGLAPALYRCPWPLPTTVRVGCFAHRLCRSLPDAAAAARAVPGVRLLSDLQPFARHPKHRPPKGAQVLCPFLVPPALGTRVVSHDMRCAASGGWVGPTWAVLCCTIVDGIAVGLAQRPSPTI
jgi:hypothetical protein